MTKYNSSDSLHIAKKISKHDLSNFYKFSLPKMKSKIHEKYNPLNCINHFSLPKVRQILKRALTNSNGVERIVLKNKARFVRSFDRSIDDYRSWDIARPSILDCATRLRASRGFTGPRFRLCRTLACENPRLRRADPKINPVGSSG